jgi:hypothetical protein
MDERYLEVSFRLGKPIAAYFYLPRQPGDHAARSVKHEGGLVVDFAPDGRAIGVEITSPATLSVEALNRALRAVSAPAASGDELRPLAA